jgi:hypothetical protein
MLAPFARRLGRDVVVVSHRHVIALAVVSALSVIPSLARADDLPRAISDRDFWRLVTELSEPDGRFRQEYMSNEDSFQSIVPAMKKKMGRGGVYVGVGPEQNFTYIAALQPQIAFVVDIRRDNMLEHLMYKALFELSRDRAEFIGRLFSRRRPPGLTENTTVDALFDAYRNVEADSTLYDDTVAAVLRRLINERQFPLSDDDKASVGALMNTFRLAGPYALRGTGDRNDTYAQLMAARDPDGHRQSYLASEENFRIVQTLERQNLLIPVVGDFAGDKAIAGIGRYLSDHGAAVNVFYVSNVERYLFEQGEHGRRFYANVATLPLAPSSTFIRSVTADISRRLGIPLSAGPENWRSFLVPISDCLKGIANGRIQSYRDLFDHGR